MKKIISILAIFSLMSALVLTGCNLSLPGFNTSPGNNSSGAGGTLNLSDVDPITLDPAVSSEMTSHDYIVQIFSGLLQLDSNLNPVPDIAQSWDISNNGTVYTFHLRNDVKFQNGRSLTAADFKYSWERAANPSTNSLTAGTYLGDVIGVNDMLAGKANQISGVKTIDNYTLQVTIDAPKSYFLSKMTYPTSFVVDKDNVTSGSSWWKKPNGTGPFQLSQWTPNTSLTLVRNNSYYGAKAQVNQVQYQFYSGLPMDLYETAKIDVTEVSVSYIDKVLDKSGPFYSGLTISPELSFSYIGFNCSKPPFNDPKIRQAFSLAVDKEKIVSLIYRNMTQKANGVLPPGLPGYNQNVAGLGFDVSKAKDLIKSSQYADVSKLPPITITTSGYGGQISGIVQALVFQWKQNLGVDVQVRQLEPDRFLYNLKTEKNEMFDMGWIADYPHPQDFLDILFRSGGDNNYGDYSNKAVDALVDQANQTTNKDLSYSLYQQAEQQIVNDAACIPLTFAKNYTLVKPYVKGYSVSALGFANLNTVSIQPH